MSAWRCIHRKAAHLLISRVMILLLVAAANANVNLELRPGSTTTGVGSTIDLGLYAVADGRESQLMSAVQVIITWNVSYLQLMGTNNAGAVTWLSSGFGSEPYGLNSSLADGNAMWIAFAQLGAANAVPATPDGTLLTTFRFQALNPTAPTTSVNIAPAGGNPTGNTIVYDGTTPNTNITGTLSGAEVTIPLPCPPDIDHNQLVNIDDLLAVITAWGMCPPMPLSCPADVTQNQIVNIDDLLAVITGWGPCSQ